MQSECGESNLAICQGEVYILKRTPLYEKHISLGARMTDFSGWMMPLQYSGILQEHEAVRTAAGLFDVSHMGQILVEGEAAGEFVQRLITNDISKIKDFQVLYSPMCYPDGGTVDDVLIYKLDVDRYMIVANAANTQKDLEWIEHHREGNVVVRNVSEDYALLALQGPMAQDILQKLVDFPLEQLRFFRFAKGVNIAGATGLISRTGYTGEDGFEIYAPPQTAVRLWDRIMEVGAEYRLAPAGLGARDTLRFEAALPLYGHELSEDVSPLEAGLDRFVRLDKGDFIGREALFKQSREGIQRRLVGLEIVDRGIARHGCQVKADDRPIGQVTSGSFSPTLKKNLALALVESRFAEENTYVDVVVRNKLLKAKVIKTPFYVKRYKK
ncbi:MAG: glycine cleavage system aminomethyltransferase GcvT [Clostridiales bacterium]|jgi:aminomethyltransferase|nr:glycine cleavage system aminomethyltransferase GcvT [Clostridiales bacterium]